MPKKRFTSQYSKPQSTVHPSLGSASAAASTSGSRNNAAPSVNDLISNLRKTQITTPEDQRKAAANVVTPTLPPSIRSLLAIPETPPPRPRVRDRRRFDENGRRIPAGPPPPPSWRDNTRNEPVFLKPRAGRDDKTRLYPVDVGHLPGVPMPTVGSLQDICLREMARNWEFIKEYEKYNLSEMPTRLRTLLLSYVAVYGPEDGVSFEGLKDVLVPPPYEDDSETQSVPDNLNDNFKRFDLSGSVGRCISFKQLSELVTKREEDESSESWEETVPMSLNPTISHITHLSLSHPPGNISWPKFLSFTQHVPTITHLSLAYWPVPNLTPNSRTTVMLSQYGREIQYGGTNLYSHSIDDDFLEASIILRRLAASLYSLQWLDLTGCTHWLGALQHLCFTEVTGLDWRSQWTSLETIVAHYGYELDEECGREDVLAFKQAVIQATCTKVLIQELRKVGRRKAWVDMQTDDVTKWDKLLTGGSKLPDQAEVDRRADDVGTRARFFGATQSWRSVNEDWVQSP